MATATTTVQLNVTGNAQQQLAKTQQSVTKLQESFGRLRNVVAGLAIGAMINNMFRAADAITDLSDATGIAVSSIMALRQAFALSGGDAEGAETAILKLFQSIDDAANGNDKLIKSFEKVGVSLNDIGTLSEEEILNKVVKNLGAMGNSAETVGIKMDLMGKQARGVNIASVAQQFDQLKASAKDAEPGLVAAGKIFDNLQKFKGEFGAALGEQFSGLLTTLEQLTSNTKSLAESLAQLVKIVTILGTAFLIFTKVLPAIRGMGNFIATMGGAAKIASKQVQLLATGFVAIFKNLGRVVPAIAQFFGLITRFGGMRSFLFALKAALGFIARFAGIAGVIYGVAQAIDFVSDKVLGLGSPLNWLGEKLSYIGTKFKEFAGLLIGGDTSYFKETAEGAEQTAEALEEANKKAQETRDRLKEIREENEKFLVTVRDVTKSFRERNAELLQGLANDIKYLNMTDEQIALDKNRIALNKEFMDTLEELGKKRMEAMADPSKGQGVVDQIDAEIKKVQESAVVTQTESAKKIKAYYAELAALKDIANAIEDTQRAFSQAEALQTLQDELSLVGLYGEELEKRQTILAAEKALREEMQRLAVNMLELESQRTRIGEDAYQKEHARIVQQMMDTKALSEAKIQAYEDEQAKKQAIDESYAEGAARAMKDMAEQFKPINMAQEAIQKGWSAIGSAVDNFVETGKFKFSDFARSVIQDLAKMIAKAMIFKAISAALGGFGLKIPGLAAGGPVEAGKTYLVGEKGPELFTPPGSGKIIPNDKLTGQGKGPVNAPITNVYNTYNINALDAKSVAQVFAENRKALFASNRLAEREMSYAGVR